MGIASVLGASALGNLTTSIGLAAAGCALLAMWLRPRERQPLTPGSAALLGALLIWLAIDEGLELHDRFGRWLWNEHGVIAPGPINHVDDMVVIGYLMVAAGLGAALLPALLRHRWFLLVLAVSGALFAAGTAFDALGTQGSWTDVGEEATESLAAILVAAAMLQAYRKAGPELPVPTIVRTHLTT